MDPNGVTNGERERASRLKAVAGARGRRWGMSVSFSAASLVCGLLAAVWVSFWPACRLWPAPPAFPAPAAVVAVAILRSCPVCQPHGMPLLSVRGRHTVRTSTTSHLATHRPPADSILNQEPPRVDGKCHWQWHSFACNWLSQLVAFYCRNVLAELWVGLGDEWLLQWNVGESYRCWHWNKCTD